MERKNAIRLMSSLSQNVIPLIANLPEIERKELLTRPFRSFHIDTAFNEEQVVNIDDGLSVRVLMTPGHTRDMLSYYIPEKKILIATESAGCLGRNGRIVNEFLVDYDGYIGTLERFRALDIEILCQGHHFVFTGEDVQRFLADSLQTAQSFKEHVNKLLRNETGSIDKVIDIIKHEEYDVNQEVKQPERAYLINLRTQIVHLAEQLKERSK
jgi:glyoxylase-like metal-dependent hydrolase (beta-lactamase superfamily II)